MQWRPISVRVFIGSGGVGKTRLALELCEEVSVNWNAGFITGSELSRFFRQQNLSGWAWQKPTLIVVDYAAEHAALLGEWLDELTDRNELPKHPLRLLLLERSANTDTGWWTTVFSSGGWGSANKCKLLDPSEPVPILPLAHADDRLALLAAMLAAKSPRGHTSASLENPEFRDQLMQLNWGGDPLFLMMAALAMIQVGYMKALKLGRTDLAHDLAAREADRLQKLAKAHKLDPTLVQHLVACVTLAQGISREDFERFAFGEKEAIHRQSGGDAAQLADLLQEALPRLNGIAPVLPDLIGEALLLRILREDAGKSAVLRCHDEFGHQVVESVSRCAQDFSPESPVPLQWLEGITLSINDDENALTALVDSLPVESVAFRNLNLQVAQRLYELCAVRKDAPTHNRAAALNRLALARAMAGQPGAALSAAQKSVDLYRELPDIFQPALAKALNNLGNRLARSGMPKPALEATQEALDIYRDLAINSPDVYQPLLGGTLNNLATRLIQSGQDQPGLLRALEAVNLYRALDNQKPEVFQPGLALSLHTLANSYQKLNQFELGLEPIQMAVEIRRVLAAQQPDIFQPYLAISLNTLSAILGGLGQRKLALKAAHDEIKIRCTLTSQRPAVFRPNLALSLNNLSNRLDELGRRKIALRAAQGAVEIYKELVAEHQNAHKPDLARSLIVLALRTRDTGNAPEALMIAEEAIETLLPEFLSDPDAHASMMNKIEIRYREICKTVGQEPDNALLKPLLPYETLLHQQAK